MRGRWRSLKESREGSTLVEMVVVLAIMAILLAWTGGSVLRYCRYAQWREQEEQARSIYLAVQSELVKRAGEGRLSRLEAFFGDEDILDITALMGPDGQTLTAGAVWASKEGSIYVLEAPAGDREEEREAKKRQALYELLGPYMPDKTFLQEGSVRVELDPSAGTVYGVFYSRYWPDGFCCGPDGTKGDIADRRAEALRGQRIGYYGVDTLSGTVDGRAEKPVIRGLELGTGRGEGKNGGKRAGDGAKGQITLHWQVDAADLVAWKDLTYEVKIYGSFREDAGLLSDGGGRGRVEQEICRIVLDPELFGEERPTAYPGIPSRFFSLASDGGYQVMQALVCQDEVWRWYCFPVMLDEAGCQIFLVLDQWRGSGAAEEEGEDESFDSRDGRRAKDRASKSDSAYGRGQADSSARGQNGLADRSRIAGLAGWSEDVLPWFSLKEQVQEAGWELSQLEGVSCTVVGYGAGYVDTRMKESNWEPLELAEEEDGESEG